jgi:hypothetical protein
MKALLMKLLSLGAGHAPAPELKPSAPSKRRYGKGKPRHPVPRGAMRGDINGNLIEQARHAGGIKR